MPFILKNFVKSLNVLADSWKGVRGFGGAAAAWPSRGQRRDGSCP